MLWTILRRFGYEDTYNDSLKADTTEGTKLKNFMTLEEAIHDAFDDMELWYETVPSELYIGHNRRIVIGTILRCLQHIKV
ncbi:hypothetical protein EVJ58_g6278 [Rhodofomes roseus]|uniref:Uncharacterized protein n=1 Tax=Rhodofomes roseus TaxID=34475 RepID=A0A4Y9Y917_9APHY|nr:hypothetical protein EVJ58_g6278 [Rhodofomes roseus]